MKNKVTLFALLIFFCVGRSSAEGSCPLGFYPIGAPPATGCAPIPSYSQPGANQRAYPGRWEERFGAIAVDSPQVSLFGIAESKKSKSAAEGAALADCRAKGGRGCEVLKWYANGCSAVAVGVNKVVATSGDTKDEAARLSLAKCASEAEGCRVHFTTCSNAELIM